ncbi:MAG: winged helix DNA-binding domain-containing protein [Geodermatophilaceae bacterium]|nr:winged helix DNA-binding domain-containing protein [Geodermatophilaceae bacterium]
MRILSDRELTVALLARQLLLERRRLPVSQAVQRLGALQAQYSPSPYVALHSRLDAFRPSDLEEALRRGRVVKSTLMRGTLHLVHGTDYASFTAACLAQSRSRVPVPVPEGLPAEIAAFAATPRTTDEIREYVEPRIPPLPNGYDALNVARAVTPLVHVPPSGYLAQHGKFSLTAARVPLPADPAATALVVRRYLAAFGPATRDDIAAFTYFRLRDLDAALTLLQPLRRLTDGRGRDLLDLPRAPLPADDVATPVRLLARWDAAVLSHRDRTRIVPAELTEHVVRRANGDFLPTVLVAGLVAGSWSHHVSRERAVLTVRLLRGAAPAELEAEAMWMLGLLAPAASHRELAVT